MILVVLAISTSRLFLGVHFLSGVIGGIVLGLAWLSASTAAFSWLTLEAWSASCSAAMESFFKRVWYRPRLTSALARCV